MRLALDARWLQQPLHGIARYTLNLIQSLPLKRGDSLLLLYNRLDFTPFERPGLIWIDCNTPLFAASEPLRISHLLRRLKPDLLHVPAYWMPYAPACPWVMTIHDLIHLTEPGLKYRLYYAWLRRRIRAAAGVMTVSRASVAQLRDWAGIQAELSYPGVEASYRPGPPRPEALASLGITRPFFLYVGNPKPHKQADLALRASAALDLPHQLVTLGIPATDQPGHLALRGLPEDLMPLLYRSATALLLPSLAEGFGLPGAEATACACPVLASDLAVFREVLPAATLLPATDAAAWSQAMEALLRQPPPAALLTQAATEAQQRFSCRQLGEGSRAFYQRALSQPGSAQQNRSKWLQGSRSE